MTQSKLGTGTNYAGLSGFTWPSALQGPQQFSLSNQKKHYTEDIPKSDVNLIIDFGSASGIIGLNGEFSDEDDLDSLAKQISYTNLNDDGEIINFNQKLYLNSSTKFMWVRGQGKNEVQSWQVYGAFQYTVTLTQVLPWKFYDSLGGASDTTTGTSKTLSGDDLDNEGNAYVWPWFEITNNTGNDITAIEISDGTNKIVIDTTLAAGESLRVIQEYNPDYDLNGFSVYHYSTTDFSDTPTAIAGMKAVRVSDGTTPVEGIFLGGDSSSNSITFTLTGNSNTATVAVRFRERDY